jgi:hypothetical protein
MLGIGCDRGFGVGHTRATETRGIWMWSEPVERAAFIASAGDAAAAAAAATQTNTAPPPRLLFIDTEGFESAGQADAYDDRIFALATVLSSVLVYNLPEALRESDVEKLSFAAQLADALYDSAAPQQHDPRDADAGAGAGAGAGAATASQPPPPSNAVAPGAMVWLIQRDFLGGASAQEALDAALAPVPNPGGDAGIGAVNGVRAALRVIARSSTAASLPQPHLDRTALCELGDDALAPAYRAGRAKLKALIGGLAAPKVVAGAILDGPGLASLLNDLITALNAREVPSASAILASFNRDLGHTVVSEYETALRSVALPKAEADLEAAHAAARAAALAHFHGARFGRAGGWGAAGAGAAGAGDDPLAAALDADIASAWASARDRNELASTRACGAAVAACEEGMDAEGRAALPSSGRWAARYEKCVATFEATCVGPAAADAAARLARSHDRELATFTASYNDRLASALSGLSLFTILAGRFLLKAGLVEGAGWLAFAVLQLYPRARWGPGGSMYETRAWRSGVVRGWEAVARFPAVWVVGALAGGGWCGARCVRRVRDRAAARRKGKAPTTRGKAGAASAADRALPSVPSSSSVPSRRPAPSIAARLLYGDRAAAARADGRDLEV